MGAEGEGGGEAQPGGHVGPGVVERRVLAAGAGVEQQDRLRQRLLTRPGLGTAVWAYQIVGTPWAAIAGSRVTTGTRST